ncbi:protein of unknown function [Georgfuchsia toluolica]|uniref:Uncharacterized protein n=1 Tax=Georgfuchsia toluolica TaxID=424218 RepID=A0A916J4H2_9PROT|nr:hypothetical protein [Georgfuchsia toluolica]CAG4883730.1 protein of unknown function [Georgfuchsia toluolica]
MTNILNITQRKERASKMERRASEMLAELWPEISEEYLWDRKKAAGFTTMPRTMAYLMNMIGNLTKGQNAGMTYLTIWCRLFYSGIVELPSEKQMAFETGFTGERAVDTWRKRMRHLKRLGFIDYKGGADHDFQWVLVYNPHHVVCRLGTKVQPRLRAAWLDRAIEIGAKDMDELPEMAIKRREKEIAKKAADETKTKEETKKPLKKKVVRRKLIQSS